MEIMFSWDGDDSFVLYQIEDLDPARINGWLMRDVAFAGGRYVQTTPTSWTELGDDGAIFEFEQQARDEWSVYLLDVGRDVGIQLDLWRGEILYTAPGQQDQVLLYEVTGEF